MNSSDCFANKEHVRGVDRALTIHPHLLVIIGLTTSLLTAFIITSNVMLVVVLIFSRFYSNNKRGNSARFTSSNVSKNTSLLMTSLVVCNTIQGVVSMPMAVNEIINNGHWTLGPQACTVRHVSDVNVGCASIYHVICMATDMYIAVCKPLKYRLLPAKIGYYMIGACWLTPCALILPPMILGSHSDSLDCFSFEKACINIFEKHLFVFCMIISLLIPFLAISTMYVLIVRTIVHYHKRKPNNFYPAKDTELPKESFQCPSNGTLPEEELESDRIEKIFSVGEMKRIFVQQNFKNHDIVTSDFQVTAQEIAVEKCYVAETNVKEVIEMTTGLQDKDCISVKNLNRNQIDMTLMSLRRHVSNPNLAIAIDCCSEVALDGVSSPTRIITPDACIGKSTMLSCTAADLATRRTKSLHVPPTHFFKPTSFRLPSVSMESYNITHSQSPENPLNCSRDYYNRTPSKSPEKSLNSSRDYYNRSPSKSPEIPLNSSRDYYNRTPSKSPEKSLNSSRDYYNRIQSKSPENPLNTSRDYYHRTPSKSPEITLTASTRRTSPSPRRNVKAFRNIGCIMACFSLCWFPFCFFLIVFVYNPSGQPAWSLQAIAWLGYMSTAVSPVVLCGNKNVRAAIKSLMDSLSRSKQV